MDKEFFQEKMDPAHRANFCRMLGMKELPECMLEEYVKAKMMADRVDGHLGIGTLVLIALIAGYDPQTGKFLSKRETTEGEDERLQAQADEMAVKSPLDEAADQVIEKTVEQTAKETAEKNAGPVEVPTMTGAEVEGEIASGSAKPVGAAEPTKDDNLWSLGMSVNVLAEEELKQGKIVGIFPATEKPVRVTVEYEDGEVATVDEDEVEAL